MSSDKPAAALSANSVTRVVLASFIGTTIEWYDFFLYGTAAALVFNDLFFPTLDPFAGTMASFATYAVGFFARPIGGIVFGHFGDDSQTYGGCQAVLQRGYQEAADPGQSVRQSQGVDSGECRAILFRHP